MNKIENDFDLWQFIPGDIQDPQNQEALTFFDEFHEDEDGQVFIDLESPPLTNAITNLTERESFVNK